MFIEKSIYWTLPMAIRHSLSTCSVPALLRKQTAATLSWEGFLFSGRLVPKDTKVKSAHGFREGLRFLSLSHNK